MLVTSNSAAPAWPQSNPAPVSNNDQDSTASRVSAAAAAAITGSGGPNTAAVGHTPIAGSARSVGINPVMTATASTATAAPAARNQHDQSTKPVTVDKQTVEVAETPVRQDEQSSQKFAEQAQSRMAIDLQIKSISTQTGQTGTKAIAEQTIVNQAVSAYMEYGPDRQQAKANKAA